MKTERQVVIMIKRLIHKKCNLLHSKDYQKSKELQDGVAELDNKIELLTNLFEG